MRRPILLVALWLFIPLSAYAFQASCWVLTDLQGPAQYKDNGYKTIHDRFSRAITILFNGNGVMASGDNMSLYQIGDYAAVGAGSNMNLSATETYLIDPQSQTVLYTKSEFGYGAFANMTSTKMFRGKAVRCR